MPRSVAKKRPAKKKRTSAISRSVMLRLASDPQTPADSLQAAFDYVLRIHKLANSFSRKEDRVAARIKGDPLLLALAANPNCSASLLADLFSMVPDRVLENVATSLLILDQGSSWLTSMHAIAASRNAVGVAALVLLSTVRDKDVLRNLLHHPMATGPILERVFETFSDEQVWGKSNTHHGDLKEKIARHPNANTRTLVGLLFKGSRPLSVQQAAFEEYQIHEPHKLLLLLIEHPNFPWDDLRPILRDAALRNHDVSVLRVIVSHPSCDRETINAVAEAYIDDSVAHGSILIHMLLSACGESPLLDVALMERLASKPGTGWCISIAVNKGTPIHILAQLVEHPEVLVRSALAERPDLPSSLREVLLHDRNIEVRTHAAAQELEERVRLGATPPLLPCPKKNERLWKIEGARPSFVSGPHESPCRVHPEIRP